MISPKDIEFQDVPSGLQSVGQVLGKSEASKILTKHQNLIVDRVMNTWAKEAEAELNRILEEIGQKNGK